MKVFTLLRLTAPAVGISGLLLGLAVGAAWYVHDLQKRTASLLANELVSVRAAQELEISIREVRTQFDRYLINGDRTHLDPVPRLRKETDHWLDEAERVAVTPREQELMQRVREGYNHFFREYDRLTREPPPQGVYWRISDLIDNVLTKEILEPAHEYLRLNEAMLTRASAANQEIAYRVVLGLIGLGVCGAVGGLLAGWSLAAVKRSVWQTQERLRDTADRLSQMVGPAPAADGRSGGGLDEAVRSVTDSIAAVVDRLQRSQRDALRAEQLAWVGQMAAGIAHEVRNPLMAIKLLVQAAADSRGPFRTRDLEVLEEEIGRLEGIINNFLDFARPPRLEKRRVDVRPLIGQAIDGLAARADLQGVKVEVVLPAEPLELEADPGQVRQVLYNLLFNALDALPGGGRVRVEASEEQLHPESDPVLVLRVEDDGPGLPPSLGERIFEPFVSTKESGMGLGLSICRRIVEDHGGSLRATNGPKGGASFTVRLPLAARVEAA